MASRCVFQREFWPYQTRPLRRRCFDPASATYRHDDRGHRRAKFTVAAVRQCESVAQALLDELGEPLLSSTLLLPGHDEPMTKGWEIKETLDHTVDAVLDAGECSVEPTTVIDLSDGKPEIICVGSGDITRFE
jgi:tRNA A37 threonylcarbamoyladenosine synthetase subunit TsaC/SUA5/YrdC